jgi:hypothetical protein
LFLSVLVRRDPAAGDWLNILGNFASEQDVEIFNHGRGR